MAQRVTHAKAAFDVAAEAYDRFMGAWSRQLAAPMADLADVRAGQRVLDVGCGPGVLTAELVARLGASSVAAVDPSEPFVAATRERYPGVDVRLAAAESLPFPAAAFHAAIAQLVVHFLTDPDAGIREMARVTRPGGRIAACVWDFGADRGPLGPFWTAAREVDPAVHDESDLPGAREGALVRLFETAGLREVTQTDLVVHRSLASFDAWWEPFTRGVGPAGRTLADLDDGRRVALREACRRELGEGPFDLTAHAWAVTGVV